MHHGSGSQNVQRQLQRSKSFTGSDAEEQQQQPAQQPTNLPQSPVTTFAASPSAPQSPNYQIIMSRSPVTGQNMNITLQNVGQMVAGNQQITLAPLPIQNPASPGFQHSTPQWRFEHGSPSYIQVTSPLPQQVQPQSPTQHSPVPLQGVQRPGAPASGLSMCAQSPTRFVDAGMLVRQINLNSPSSSGHFVYQDSTGLAQLTSTTPGQVQLASPGAPGSARERRLSQPHSQTGGTIHHLGPQSPAASGATLPTLGSPGHITTSNLPPQISSIIQGQLGVRPMIFEKTSQGVVTGVGGPSAAYGMPSNLPPSSPSRANPQQVLSNAALASASTTGLLKKQPKKLEEIAPSGPEIAQLRKQCLEHHAKKMDSLKEVFKEYLIELFFLQHLQGNMMDFLAFKKKPCVPLFTYLRQNDLDLEEEEEEEQSEVINDEVKVVTGKDGQAGTPVAIATQLPPNVSAAFSAQQQQQFQQTHQGTPVAGMANAVEIEAFKRQQALAQADQAKRPRIEVGRHGMVFQHPGVATLGSPGVPLQQLMPTVQGGMPPTPQAVQIAGQKQNQQHYDPSKGPPVQNAASLHTPPPQLPGRLQTTNVPLSTLPSALQLAQQQQQQQQLMDAQVQPQLPLQVQVKAQQQGPVPIGSNPQTQLQAQLQQHMQAGLHIPIQAAQPLPQTPAQLQPGQATVALMRPGVDSTQACQRLMANSIPTSSISPATLAATALPSNTYTGLTSRPASGASITPAPQSKLTGTNATSLPKMTVAGQGVTPAAPESSQDKQAEQAKLETQVHQRVAELRKEGLWSMSRLPKLQEAPRPKSHWDYLLEEMQWMAADFAQERRWKMAAAKKLVRTCARYHGEQKRAEERMKKEEEARLRRIACTIAREVEFFWSNIEQVVGIKLQIEIYQKRRKALNIQRGTNKSQHAKPVQHTEKSERDSSSELSPSGRKRKASITFAYEQVQDEESTIEEQEAAEGAGDHRTELAELAKEAEMPLDSLVKQYAGAYAESFDWPQPSSQSEDEDRDEEMEEAPLDSPHEEVLIDSLLSMELQHRATEKMSTTQADGKPKKDIAEVAAATELILPKGSARTTAAIRNQPPFLLHGSLREYQQIGVDWLASLHKKHLNGILADETGLGKTVQTVAFLAHLAGSEGNWGPHLIVVRTCKMLSWEMEFKRWCPGLKILLYLGNRKERKIKRKLWSESNSFHVCLTSYKLLLKDQRDFLRRRWKHLVLDEVQLIKNMNEKHWDTIFSLRSQQRLLLINTPLQNTLKELWTMIHFLLPGITRPYLDFPVKPGTDENQEYCHKLVIRLHRMIQPFILRRSKRDVEKQLPKKYEHILKCRLSNRQKILYEDVMTQTGSQEALKTGHFVSVLHVLMQLQRICNHPDLIQPRSTQMAYVSDALQYTTPSLILGALELNHWKTVDLSIFDLIGNEKNMTRFETEEVLPKLKVTRKLIEEIYNSADPPARPKPVKIKPMRLFQAVQYGQKPEGRTVPLPGSQPQRTPTTTTATVSQQAQARGKSPVTTVAATQVAGTTFQKAQTTTTASAVCTPTGQHTVTTAPSITGSTASTTGTVSQALSGPAGGAVPHVGQPAPVQVSRPPQAGAQAPAHAIQQSLLPQRLVLTSQAQARLPSGDVKIAQLASIAGTQNRISQPETPVTLQFQGNKFTLSPSQLRQLTTGQPLQLQGTLGNILQIVSAPGQQILRPQSSMVMPTVPQTQAVQNTAAPGNQTPTTAPTPTVVQGKAPAVVPKAAVMNVASADPAVNAKPLATAPGASQESSEEKNRLVKERLNRVFSANERRCSRSVLYGVDLVEACSVFEEHTLPKLSAQSSNCWRWIGRDSCLRARQTCIAAVSPLQKALVTAEHRREEEEDWAKRFVCVVPPAVAHPPQLYAANPAPQYSLGLKMFRRRFQQAVAPYAEDLRRLASRLLFEFPDLQLLQMDSGKLEALAVLLHKLKSESRRVLIFTQMVKMLDILEMFLNYHQLSYVRVDEHAPLEERQEQMKTFNRNKRIFCSILTNRCGSVVGNVFDADTIVFYDTDLNPSMDSKTQEWCDKIGRSKDIHIYRLESGNSIEEKLLKNGTKDLIREVAAQGTDYTLAFLTQRTIQDLFEVESGSGEKVEEFVVLHQDPSPSETISPRVARPYIQALNSIGEDGGAHLPGTPEGEMEVEMSEDDLGQDGDVKYEVEPSQLEELTAVMEQLTPIERYALQYLEYLHSNVNQDDERRALERVNSATKEWEVQQLQRLKEEDENRIILEEEEDLFTYTREDAYNMEYVYDGADGQTEIMPVWTPPTPPQDDNDIYIDSVICLMYDATPMPESKLPPVYVRKEHKRLKMDPSAAGRKKKQRHGETVIPPRSLFDKASMLKVRREGKDQKKNFSLKQNAPFAKPLPSLVKPVMEAGQDNPEWLISEDWALLQAVKQLLELPLNLTIVSPAHTPNWDLVSDVVNSCSRIYRSPKQCRNRYENVIIPREEGKLVYDANPKKKTKSIYKSKNSRPLRTCQIYTQDDNATQIQLYNSRFELMKIIASKRSPPIKPLLGMNPFQKNPKHASVLAESGISYDKPLPPIQVASQRAERIAKEKKALAEQQRAQQLAQQQQQSGPTPQTPQPATPQAQAQTPSQPQPQAVPQAQAVAQAAANTVTNTALLAGAIKAVAAGTSIQTATVSGNVIVNTGAGSPASSFTKRLAPPVIPGTLTTAGATAAQVVHAQQRTIPASAATTEVVAIATSQGVRAVTPVTASAVVSTSLTQVQTPTRSLVTQVTPATATGMQLPQGKLSQPHLLLRHQPLQPQTASPQIKAVSKAPQEMTKTQKQKLQLAQQQQAAAVAAAQQQSQQSGQQPQATQVQQAQPANPQLTTVTASRAGAMLTTNVRLVSAPRTSRLPGAPLQAPGQIQAQPAQTAQVTLAKPPVVSVPAVVSSAGVTTLPVTMAGISMAIGPPQKAGAQVVTHFNPQVQLLQLKKQQQAAAQAAAAAAVQQRAVQPQQGQATVQQKLATQQMTVQAQQPSQQKVATYTAQHQAGMKTTPAPYIQTSLSQKQAGAPAQIQVGKLVQQQATVANIQQMVSAAQQIQAQTVTLSQAATSGQQQVQVISAGSATAQVVQQKLIQHQVVTAASSQIQTPPPHSPAQTGTPVDGQSQQQAKVQVRTTQPVRVKAPTKPS
ncbi:E1A-binding protein p400 isoform X3 [Amia ocellicauda]|uniref:E1A-binding protein p400 isoform X3 n=1 Tax=Amia ocellicauda TaxID=2972642 RepID=UPI003464E052